MIGICKLRNSIQSYPWGSRTALAELLGQPVPAPEPQAELWMGAHPKAPSAIEVDGAWRSLADVIRELPGEVLGPSTATQFDAMLPFLFKVLAADRALSIQAHPDSQQARAGFERENQIGLTLTAPRRNYRDPRHKPEILCALEPFWILRGFRSCAEIIERWQPLGLEVLLPEVSAALRQDDLKRFFTTYMGLDARRLQTALARALGRLGSLVMEDDSYRWVVELDRQFPGDPGVLAPLFLHLLELQPGEAIFTGPGILHAYHSGVGIELMANSDNVVRGGLTAKHVDLGELLEILRFEAEAPQRLSSSTGPGERCFASEAREIDLAIVEPTLGEPHGREAGHGVEILLCTAGRGLIREVAVGSELVFAKGDALLVPAAVANYRITGACQVFRASIQRSIEGHRAG